jgi:hypothetical protein
MLQLQEMDNCGKQATTTWAAEFLLRDGERLVDQLKCGARGQEKTGQASDHVFISMWEVAPHDWSSCESGV